MKALAFLVSVVAMGVMTSPAVAQNDAAFCLQKDILKRASAQENADRLSNMIGSCDRALASTKDQQSRFELLNRRGDLHRLKAKNPKYTPEAKSDRAVLGRHANASADDFLAAFRLHSGPMGNPEKGRYGYLLKTYEMLEFTRRFGPLADVFSTRLRLYQARKDREADGTKMYKLNVASILMRRAGASLMARRFDAVIADVDHLLPRYKDVHWDISLREAWLLTLKGEALMYKRDHVGAAKLFDRILKMTKPVSIGDPRYFDERTQTYKYQDPLQNINREPRARAYFNRALIRHNRGEGEAAWKDYDASIALASKYGTGRKRSQAWFETDNEGVGRHIFVRYLGMARFMAQKGIAKADRALRATDARTRLTLFRGAISECIAMPKCTPGR